MLVWPQEPDRIAPRIDAIQLKADPESDSEAGLQAGIEAVDTLSTTLQIFASDLGANVQVNSRSPHRPQQGCRSQSVQGTVAGVQL